MNSEKPTNQSSDFPGSFDHEETEINVTYEEITSENELSGKDQAVKKNQVREQSTQNKSVESDDDIWQQQGSVEKSSQNDHPDLDNSYSTEAREQEPTKIPVQKEINTAPQSVTVKRAIVDPKQSEPLKSETPQPHKVELDSAKPKTENLEAGKTEAKSADYSDDPNLDLPINSQTHQTLENKDLQKEKIEASNSQESFSQTSDSEPKVEVSRKQPELIADSWLNDIEIKGTKTKEKEQSTPETSPNLDWERQKAAFLEEIKLLKSEKENLVAQQNQAIAESFGVMIEEGTRELRAQKKYLLQDIEKLERRRERIRMEMQANFAGASQDLAMRVQGFKEYLVGSLQDLATAAEKLELAKPEEKRRPRSEANRDPREGRRPREGRLAREEREAREGREPRRDRPSRDGRESREGRRPRNNSAEMSSNSPQFNERSFSQQTGRIRQLLDRYRTQPDYYGSPWQLRRTFESIHVDRTQQWFFEQGGRGSIKGMGSRLQNILVASAITSVLYQLYRDRCRVLVLVDSPEQLGEWRRGLQDCLGITRNDFGANRGVVLFESPEALIQRAERLLDDKLLPLIIIDESEGAVNMGLLRFPLWLAFAEKPQPSRSSSYLY